MSIPLLIPGLTVLRSLGEGGMGRVYLAEDETLGRRVAVKVVSERVAADPLARARFLREARALATVEHPNVVRVYAFGESCGSTYLTMEYIEGETLAARLQRAGPMAIEEALRVARQVVAALEAGWEKKIVHRDVKPSNILLDGRGQAHVADFGLAKSLISDADADSSLTAAGSILGTPQYMSPEQAAGRPADFRSDIYSLGIVLYEMLAGVRPFDGATPFEVVAKHIHEPLPPLGKMRPGIPEVVVRLAEQMTAKNPADRPPSYAALRDRLDAARNTPATDEAPTNSEHQERLAPLGRRSRSLLAGAAASLLVLGGVLTWRASRRPLPPSAEGNLVVAVAPFYGPDADSAKEGRIMAALVEKAIAQRMAAASVTVLGIEKTGEAIRDHAAARALGERLGAKLVVWGETFALRGETEVQPSLTMVPRARDRTAGGATRQWMETDASLASLGERTGGSLVVGAQASNQIELRRTSATGVGELVVTLAGVYALYTEDKPEKALKVFEQAPRTSEALRYRAEALLRLRRIDDARRSLDEATAADPKDCQAWGALGDLHIEADRFDEAVLAYRRASETGEQCSTRNATLYQGKLYARERFTGWRQRETGLLDSGYLLALDPENGVVVERHRLPGRIKSLRVGSSGLEVTYDEGWGPVRAEDAVILTDGRFTRDPAFGASMLIRRRGIDSGRVLAANFENWTAREFRPWRGLPNLPTTYEGLEAALGQARERDPTQVWHLFFLGQAAWWQGRRDAAETTWSGMLAGAFPGIPWFEYSRMAADFELLGQPAWADRAFERALALRRQLPTPARFATLLERTANTPFVPEDRWRAPAVSQPRDLDREHLWLARAREFGLCPEGEDLAAALWEHHFRKTGRDQAADAEADVRKTVQRDPLNYPQLVARMDYLYQVFVACTLALWATVGALTLAGARRLLVANPRLRAVSAFQGVIAHWDSRERSVLLLAWALAMLAFVPLALVTRVACQIASMPVAWSDSPGSTFVRQELERILAETDSDAARYALAVTSHLAGRTDRARELYRAVSSNPRARANLEALEGGNATPPEPLTSTDLYAAYTSLRWSTWLSSLWSFGALQRELGLGGLKGGAAPFLAIVNIVLGLVVGSTVLLLPPRRPTWSRRSPESSPLLRLLSGFDDLARGAPCRGYATLVTTALSVTAIVAFLLVTLVAGGRVPVPGLLSATGGLRWPYPYPVPAPAFWPIFWAYRDAPLFWGLVLLAAATSFALPLRAVWCRRPAPGGAPLDETSTQLR
jgi:tetratricopeptide (TPR) repeat protein/predicted Ser/Thr protein kinase